MVFDNIIQKQSIIQIEQTAPNIPYLIPNTKQFLTLSSHQLSFIWVSDILDEGSVLYCICITMINGKAAIAFLTANILKSPDRHLSSKDLRCCGHVFAFSVSYSIMYYNLFCPLKPKSIFQIFYLRHSYHFFFTYMKIGTRVFKHVLGVNLKRHQSSIHCNNLC